MENSRYIVGIDLGTTNSVAAYIDTMAGDEAEIKIFRIPQLTAPGVVEARPALPSFLYLKTGHEVSESSLQVPGNEGSGLFAVGEFARDRGAEVPHRLISSAKSWLCNPHVDREAPILPWDGPADAEKISPVGASCEILTHMRHAWNQEMAAHDPLLRLENQAIYLTVPASFDAVARELTVKAAAMAGLSDIVLIEEPQAAFYSWIDQAGEAWRRNVEKGDLVLVCDIGGGTSDFSLIEVQENDGGELVLERLAVGDHLLVGGDNIDLTLSYFLWARLQEKGKKLDSWQMRGLVHSCRKAKEHLFTGESPDQHPISILGRGSALIGGTIKTSLDYGDIESIVLNGFFPRCSLDERPVAVEQAGMKEFGLSYEADPGITRHLARFLSVNASDHGQPRLPTAVLFNGGVMKSNVLRHRVMELVSEWRQSRGGGGGSVRELDAADFDLSVARGASYFGKAVRDGGMRIRAGLGQSCYMAIEAAMPAIPGIALPTRALCIAPFGMEEGTSAVCRERLFNLIVGQTVKFDIMTSTSRNDDSVGVLIDGWEDRGIKELSSIETRLEGEGSGMVPVTFEVRLTEIGTLEFWACSRDDERRWKLELNVRPKTD